MHASYTQPPAVGTTFDCDLLGNRETVTDTGVPNGRGVHERGLRNGTGATSWKVVSVRMGADTRGFAENEPRPPFAIPAPVSQFPNPGELPAWPKRLRLA